jgi:G3E family GTPase
VTVRPRKPPIPFTVVAGPLGAGKTTLINRALDDAAFANTAVILNEFGEIGVKNALVERAEDGIVSLGGGCVCCAVRGELVDALETLLRDLDNGRIAALGRVIVEANADADPSAILAGLGMHPYLPLRFAPDGIVVVIAAPDVAALDPQTARQLAMADVVAVSKTEGRLSDIADRIRHLNPIAAILDADAAEPTALTGHGPFDPATTDIERWLGPSGETGGAHALNVFTVARQRPIPLAALDRFLDYLAALQGPNLIRVRALVAVEGGESAVVAGAGAFFLPPRLIPSPQGGAATRFSVTASGLDRQRFETYLDAFLNEARIDTPDRTAMTDNPLHVTGFSARPGGR